MAVERKHPFESVKARRDIRDRDNRHLANLEREIEKYKGAAERYKARESIEPDKSATAPLTPPAAADILPEDAERYFKTDEKTKRIPLSDVETIRQTGRDR